MLKTVSTGQYLGSFGLEMTTEILKLWKYWPWSKRDGFSKYSYTWNASRYPSGIYFATVEINGHQTIRKMTLL